MECPLCSKFFSAKRIEFHASQCGGGVTSTPPTGKRVHVDDVVELHEDEEEEEEEARKPKNAFAMLMANAASGGARHSSTKRATIPPPEPMHDTTAPISEQEDNKNAFSILMSNAKERTLVETFTFDYSSGDCVWSTDAPSNADSSLSWQGWCKLERGSDAPRVRLVGRNLPIAQSSTLDIEAKSRLPVGALKSIMQKAYRRMDLPTFRRAASELAQKSWNDFIRRLPIIILEDGSCTQAFPAIVWLMLADSCVDAASTEARMVCNNALALFCINSIHFSAQDALDHWDETTQAGGEAALDLKQLADPRQAATVFAMRARAMFGGMACDVDMCRAYARIWYARFRENPARALPSPPPNDSSNKMDKLCGFTPQCAIPTCGIDYHCQPQLFEPLLTTRFPRLKEAMWRFKSGVNFRGCSLEQREHLLAMERGTATSTGDALYLEWQRFAMECDSISAAYLQARTTEYAKHAKFIK